MARLLELEQTVVADDVELLRGLPASVLQGQQRAGADIDVALLDGASCPV